MIGDPCSTGVQYLDDLLGGLRAGDNVIWEVDSGAPVEFFTRSFLRESAESGGRIVFVSFGHSPQSIINRYFADGADAGFHLVDAFTSGFGKGDRFFADFYRRELPPSVHITHVPQPGDADAPWGDRGGREIGGALGRPTPAARRYAEGTRRRRDNSRG